jgi:hypothetical protein
MFCFCLGTSINATFDLTTLAPGGYSVEADLATVDGGAIPSENLWPFTVTILQYRFLGQKGLDQSSKLL